jgi:hypothetical protein
MKDLVGIWLETSLTRDELVNCRQLLQRKLPQFIKNGFLAYARKNIKLETPIWNQRNVFDPNDQEVKVAREKLLSALQMSVRFNKLEVEACIRNTLKIRIDFIMKPGDAIKTFFYRNKEFTHKNLILRSVDNYGFDIPFLVYLSQELKSYQQNSIHISVINVLIRKTHEELYHRNRLTTLSNEFDLLMDFYNVNGSSDVMRIERHIVEELLEARGCHDILSLIQIQGLPSWSKKEIWNILVNVPKIRENYISGKTRSLYPKVIFPEDDYLVVQKTKIEQQPPGPYPSIFDFIEQKDWKRFVKKLFVKDEIAFERFVLKIDSLTKWRDAKQVIDWELEKRHLDPYSKEAVKLGDVIFAKYFSKGEYE